MVQLSSNSASIPVLVNVMHHVVAPVWLLLLVTPPAEERLREEALPECGHQVQIRICCAKCLQELVKQLEAHPTKTQMCWNADKLSQVLHTCHTGTRVLYAISRVPSVCDVHRLHSLVPHLVVAPHHHQGQHQL